MSSERPKVSVYLAISLDDALACSDNPDDLKLVIRGVETGVASRMTGYQPVR